MTKIWELWAAGDRNLAVSPVDLTFFSHRFDSRSLRNDWHPPQLVYLGKSKKLRDFVGWMVTAPLVSARAAQLIKTLCKDDVEFLPFHDLKGKPYFAMNVLRTERVLDLDRSDVIRDKRTGEVVNLFAAALLEELPSNLPPVFKDSHYPANIFVTEQFARMAVESGLTGLALADPTANQLNNIVKGIDQNVYPGIVT